MLNPLKPNGISNSYQSDRSIPILRGVGGIFIHFLLNILKANSEDPYQTPQGFLRFPMSHTERTPGLNGLSTKKTNKAA